VEERTAGLIGPERLVRGRPSVERLALALAETARWDTAPAHPAETPDRRFPPGAPKETFRQPL
jgi:hypothetical protein